ncbi:MAG: glycosyltransferase family 2 protein [Candidatus Staskawiczbacteria bacterium]|nr:glycosyltransferase family 2 protein [Candidatus Staskawiczbacteria bacterium]
MNHEPTNKPLISIAIPTYNRADFLKNLLNNIMPQVEEMNGLVEICISNNDSNDKTHEVATSFREKYSDLIKYNKNQENIGADRNILKLMEMAQGDFIWTLGDDDLIIEGGIKMVVNFVDNKCDKNTGLVIIGCGTNIINKKTVKSSVYSGTAEKTREKIYKIKTEDVMGTSSGNSFLSVLIFNSDFVKRTIEEEVEIVEKATGKYFTHAFLYQLMLLKYPQLDTLKFNELIIEEGPHYRKPYIEDEFKVFYVGRKKLNDLLVNSGYMNDFCRMAIVNDQKKLKMFIFKQMAIMKVFDNFNFFSFPGCLKLFFQGASLGDAIFLSVFFVIIYITPAFIMRGLYKIFIKIKYSKEWEKIWLRNIAIFEKSKVDRRAI